MSNSIIARKKGFSHKFDFAMSKIWMTMDNQNPVGNYVLIHFLDNSDLFGYQYFSCENQSHLNDIKSKILNNGFKIDWIEFNKALEWLNDN